MGDFDWDVEKNIRLQTTRGVSFDDIVTAINQGDTLDDYSHPNSKRYPNQRISVVKINNYAYLVPYVETMSGAFLKTIIPSRKATKKYLNL
jgi:uncharacterized DUF497 family protein